MNKRVWEGQKATSSIKVEEVKVRKQVKAELAVLVASILAIPALIAITQISSEFFGLNWLHCLSTLTFVKPGSWLVVIIELILVISWAVLRRFEAPQEVTECRVSGKRDPPGIIR